MADKISFRNASFKFKVMSVMVLASAFSLLIAGGIFLIYEARTFKRDHIIYLSSIGDIIGSNITSALLFDDEEAGKNTMSCLSSERSVKECGVFRNDGNIFIRYIRNDVSGNVSPPAIMGPGAHFENEQLYFFLPIVWKGESLGTVYICSDMAALNDRLRQHGAITIVILCISVIGAILLSLWLHRFISTPVLQLTQIARTVSEKQDFSVRAPATDRSDEFGVLVRGFNRMLEQIQEHNATIQEARNDLERTVDERTKEVREMDLMLRGILFNMPVVAFRIDNNGIFTHSAGKGLERLGLKQGEVVGKSAFDIYPDLAEHMKSAMDGKMVSCEAVGVRDGEEWCFSTYFFPDVDKPGQIAGFALDITKRKRAEDHERILQEQLIRSERMRSLGVLAGGVAHDLNNILGPMVILPKVIIDDLYSFFGEHKGEMGETFEDLKAIESSARRAADVIKDLMTLGRRGNYQKHAVDLNVLVKTYIESRDFKDISSIHSAVECSMHLAENIPPVLCSETHLTRVISNIVQNGFEAISGAGKLTVCTRYEQLAKQMIGYETIPAGEYAVLSVGDNGAGIPEKYMERIFEPFFTKKKQTTRSGSGLGLSVVHGVVKDHDGYVNVKSNAGDGTVFDLYFPASAETVNGDGVNAPVERGNEHILVVDDEPAQRQLSKRVLEKLGYTVVTAENGHAALDVYAGIKSGHTKPFDLILLDMIMEDGFDGLTTLEHVLAINPLQKVIIASGYAPTKRGEATLKLGATWLSKPYGNDELARAVRRKLTEEQG